MCSAFLSVSDILSFGKWAYVCLDSELYGFVKWHHKFLSTFTSLQKAAISFVVSVCPFVRVEQLTSYWTDFHDICFFLGGGVFFENRSRKFYFH